MREIICTVDARTYEIEFDHDWVAAALVNGTWLDVEIGSFGLHHSHQIVSPQGLKPDDTFASFCTPTGVIVDDVTLYRLVMVRLGAIAAFKFANADEVPSAVGA